MASESASGARIIARAIKDLGIQVIFGIVGIPVIEIAEQAIGLGIRFIGFRNEQAAGYAATAYGYLTGKPGTCLVVGGPGVLHAMAGVSYEICKQVATRADTRQIGNSNANRFPMLLLAGSSESHITTKGGFQELDAISLLTPHTKLAIRPPDLESIPQSVSTAYRSAFYGVAGTGFVDLPADLIQGESTEDTQRLRPLPAPPVSSADAAKLFKIAQLLKSAKAPLIVVGKGAAYAQAEGVLRELVNKTSLPFLPSPMGKGVLPDSHSSNTASARSTALAHADIVLLLGARLNWIFHFGEAPKWNPKARFIQVDNAVEEIGRNGGDAELGIVGDIRVVVEQLTHHLADWHFDASTSEFVKALTASKKKNEEKAAKAAAKVSLPLSYAHAFSTIKSVLYELSPPEQGGIVYVSEGANTMDISRSAFDVEHPRLRLDAGTYATMGVGMGYAIAAHEAFNGPFAEATSGPAGRKKIVALEGDSAFGFSAMEIETMARYQMDVLIFVMNNGGVYHGDSDTSEEWLARQKASVEGKGGSALLRSTSLGWEVGYEKLAEACGGKGYMVRTPEELAKATKEGFQAKCPVIVNVIIESGKKGKLVSVTCTVHFMLGILTFDRNSAGRPARKRRRRTQQSCRHAYAIERFLCMK